VLELFHQGLFRRLIRDQRRIKTRKDKRGFDLISDALPFGGLWYLKVADANRLRETPLAARIML
jgi:hypothetical protein